MAHYVNYVEKYKSIDYKQRTLTVTNIGMLSNLAIAFFYGITNFSKNTLFLNPSAIYYFILGGMKWNILKKNRDICSMGSMTDKKMKERTMYQHNSRFFYYWQYF